jgi:serpin B
MRVTALMQHFKLPSLLAVVLLVSACSAAASPAPVASPNPQGTTTPTDPAGIVLARADIPRATAAAALAPDAANAINGFGFDLYGRLASHPGNLVFSPASIELALAMARPGARGATATQMDKVMHGAGADALGPAINALQAALESRNGTFMAFDGNNQPVALHVANSAFGQRDLTFLPDYLAALASRFGAGIRLVNYKTDAEGARGLINQWVSDQTEKRIPQLLQAGTLDEMTRLVLVNAIYMKAPWLTPFVKDMTGPGAFTRVDGSVVQVPLMSRPEMSLPYAKGAGWQAVELPYLGGALAMDVIVPNDFNAFQATLNGGTFADAVAAMTPHMVDLSMPKFDIQTSTDLGEQLVAMGMPLAFDGTKADFSGMTAQEQLYISAVIHQANITVDESGTEAAAATAVVMGTTSLPVGVVNLTIDHPFLFAVRDVPTGAVLFLGRVVDPTAGR